MAGCGRWGDHCGALEAPAGHPPPSGEFVPGYDASGWNGIGAPKGTPTEVIDRLNGEINAVIADPMIKAHLVDLPPKADIKGWCWNVR
jgi:hypothetical protein